MLLLSALAYGAGCAENADGDTGETAPEATFDEAEARRQQPEVYGEIENAKQNGESFERAGQEALAEVEALPEASLAVNEGQPTIQYLKGRGPHPSASFNTSGAGRNYGGSTIYYPRDQSTDLAGVVMCPGFTALKSSLAGWGPFFASHGIVLMTIDTKTVMDQVIQRAPEIQQALDDLKKFGNDRNELRGRMGDKWGVSGWSMGGGGTWLTAAKAERQNIKTAVTLAGHNSTAGGAFGVDARQIKIPTLMMNGSTDVTILGGLGQSSSAYNAIPNSTPKLHWETGTCGHFCWGGPNAGGGISGVFMMAWQKTFLEGDERFKVLLNRSTAQASGARTTTFNTNVQ